MRKRPFATIPLPMNCRASSRVSSWILGNPPRRCQRLRGECSGINQGGVRVQRTEASIEVIAVIVDKFRGDDLEAHFCMAVANLSTPPRVERKP